MKPSELKRKTGLSRSKGLGPGKRSRKAARRSQPEYLAAKQAAWLRSNGRCASCNRPASQPHHIFPEQKWPELLCESDNIIYVCPDCHAAHESCFRRLERYSIRRAERLAVDDSMRAYLDRTYPNRERGSA